MVLTGGYHSSAHVIDLQRRINTTIAVRFLDKRGKQCGVNRFYKNKRLLGSINLPTPQSMGKATKATDVAMQDNQADGETTLTSNANPSNDLSQRISMGAWHPKDNTFAVAKHNSLFVYTEKRSITSSNGNKNANRDKDVQMGQ